MSSWLLVPIETIYSEELACCEDGRTPFENDTLGNTHNWSEETAPPLHQFTVIITDFEESEFAYMGFSVCCTTHVEVDITHTSNGSPTSTDIITELWVDGILIVDNLSDAGGGSFNLDSGVITPDPCGTFIVLGLQAQGIDVGVSGFTTEATFTLT